MAEIDLEVVRHALKVARENGFASVEISEGIGMFSATLEPRAAAPSVVASAVSTLAPSPALAIKAPVVGFYRDTNPALSVGQEIRAGDVVAEIVALGIANDVESKVTGVVTEILVVADQAVEYGQIIALVEPQ